MERKSSNDARA